MKTPALLVFAPAALCIFGVILYRLAWAASSTASATAQGRLPILPKRFRAWLLGDPR